MEHPARGQAEVVGDLEGQGTDAGNTGGGGVGIHQALADGGDGEQDRRAGEGAGSSSVRRSAGRRTGGRQQEGLQQEEGGGDGDERELGGSAGAQRFETTRGGDQVDDEAVHGASP